MTGQSPGIYHAEEGSSSSAAQNQQEPVSHNGHDEDDTKEPELENAIFNPDSSSENFETKLVIFSSKLSIISSQRQGFLLKGRETLSPACGFQEFYQAAPKCQNTLLNLSRQREAVNFAHFLPITTRKSP